MRRSIFGFLFVLTLAACANNQESQQTAYNHRNDETWLQWQASNGNADAQIQLGEYYCEMEPKGSGNPKAVAWWQRTAANQSNPEVAAEAMHYLGEYYLALYINTSYDPKTSKKVSMCNGRKAGDTDYAAAEKWLLACSKTISATSLECNAGLGHLYSGKKQYDKAYFWFATVLAGRLTDDFDPKTGERGARGILPIDAKFYGAVDARNARRAAIHLSHGKVDSINAEAIKWMKDWNDTADEVNGKAYRKQHGRGND